MGEATLPLAAAGAAVSLLVVLVVLRRRRAASAGRSSPGGRLRGGLRATSQRLAAALDAALDRRASRPTGLEALEEALIGADVGARTAGELVERVRAVLGDAAEPRLIRSTLRREIETMLEGDRVPEPAVRPWVVLVTGVNGVGKTTTVGKLAAQHVRAGRRVLLVAADTFRAAAIDQLAVWAERAGAQLVRHEPGGDPAAVVFDGMRAALAREVDVVLVDTAGRLHTRANLMEELRKLVRVMGREVPGAPHERLLVLDATTGQNALAQARTFTESTAVTGIVLTKLDGTARGGMAIAIRRELGVPLHHVGVGEDVDDLRPFDAHEFVAALFGEGGTGDVAAGANPLTAAAGDY